MTSSEWHTSTRMSGMGPKADLLAAVSARLLLPTKRNDRATAARGHAKKPPSEGRQFGYDRGGGTAAPEIRMRA
jgi:hypothetical protein